MATRRLQREYQQLEEQPKEENHGISVKLVEDDLFHWHAFLPGDPKSPYSKGTFTIDLQFPKDYPFRPPKIKYLTKIYHPNITENGDLACPLVFTKDWSPTCSMDKAIQLLWGLFMDVNPDDDVGNLQAALLYKRDRDNFNNNAQEWTTKYAMCFKNT